MMIVRLCLCRNKPLGANLAIVGCHGKRALLMNINNLIVGLADVCKQALMQVLCISNMVMLDFKASSLRNEHS